MIRQNSIVHHRRCPAFKRQRGRLSLHLLVNESYGTRGDAKQAHFLGHSTAAEAGSATREAGAKQLLLTDLCADRFADPEKLVVEAGATFGLGLT